MNLLKGNLLIKSANNLFFARFGINTSKLYCNFRYISCSQYHIQKYGKISSLDGTGNEAILHHTRSYSKHRLSIFVDYVNNILSSLRHFNERNRLAYVLYRTIDTLNFEEFYRILELPDTFNSWFVIVELHIWMLTSQVMDLKSGIKVRNALYRVMWLDVEERLRNLGPANRKIVRKQLKELHGRSSIALWVYDEGLLSTDIVLAGALWYKFFDKNCDDPVKLEVLVRYVRHQIERLSGFDLRDCRKASQIENMWEPFANHAKAVLEG